MYGSTVPGLTEEVLRADAAARLRAAEQRRAIAAVRRQLREARAEERRAAREARADAPRRQPLWRVRHLVHRPGT